MQVGAAMGGLWRIAFPNKLKNTVVNRHCIDGSPIVRALKHARQLFEQNRLTCVPAIDEDAHPSKVRSGAAIGYGSSRWPITCQVTVDRLVYLEVDAIDHPFTIPDDKLLRLIRVTRTRVSEVSPIDCGKRSLRDGASWHGLRWRGSRSRSCWTGTCDDC